MKLLITSLQNPKLSQLINTDSLGRFQFDLIDKYGQDINISVQSTVESYLKSEYIIEFNERKSPAISFDQKESILSTNKEVLNLIEKHHEQEHMKEEFVLGSEEAKEEYFVMITEKEQQSLKNDGKGAQDFYWEQQMEKQWRIDAQHRVRFPELHRDEIFYGYIRSKLPVSPYIGNNPLENKKPVDLANNSIPVFSPPREFYAPKHENLTPKNWMKPDLRALIHWAPLVETDSQGKASISFYNADVTGDMQVIVEAISSDGKIGYETIEYQVKKKSK